MLVLVILVSTDGMLADPSPGGGKEDDYIQLWIEVELWTPKREGNNEKKNKTKKDNNNICNYV